MRGEWNSLQAETFDKIIILFAGLTSRALKIRGSLDYLTKLAVTSCQSLSEGFQMVLLPVYEQYENLFDMSAAEGVRHWNGDKGVRRSVICIGRSKQWGEKRWWMQTWAKRLWEDGKRDRGWTWGEGVGRKEQREDGNWEGDSRCERVVVWARKRHKEEKGERALNGARGRYEGASYVIPQRTISSPPIYVGASVKGSINSFAMSITFLHSDIL